MRRSSPSEHSEGARYDLARRIARHSMAEVWIARTRTPTGQKKTVVLKTMVAVAGAEDMVSRVLRTAQIAAELDHPNIARVLDTGELGEADYVALEYVPGRTLGQLRRALRVRGAVPPLWFTLAVFSALCDGLEHAHDRAGEGTQPGLAHRHLCPELLAVAFTGVPKILDFGIADDFGRADPKRAPRRDYRAPEQRAGGGASASAAASIDGAQADIYSLGVILFEMLTGRHPYPDLDASAPRAIAGREPPAPSKIASWVPETLDSVLLMAMAGSPANRYESAGQMRAALKAQLAALGVMPTAHNIAAYMMQVFGEPGLADAETALSVPVGQIPGAASCTTDEPEPEGPPVEGFDDALPVDITDVLTGPDREAWNRLGAEDQPRLSRSANLPPAREPASTSSASLAAVEVPRPRAPEPAPAVAPPAPTPALPPVKAAPPAAAPAPIASPRPARTPYLLGGAVIAALGAAAVVYRGTSKGSDIAAPAISAAPAASASARGEPLDIEIIVIASPPDARLSLDDTALGDNPFRARVNRDHKLHRVRAVADGYTPREEAITFDRDQTIRLKLQPDAGAPAPPSPRAPVTAVVAAPTARPTTGPTTGPAPARSSAPQAGDDLQKTTPPPAKTIDRKDPYAP